MARRIALLLAVFGLAVAPACTVDAKDPGGGSDPVDAAADTDAGELLPFMSECTDNAECDTGLCYQFNQGPARCTHGCEIDDDCEAPSGGCNGMGVCKRPDGDNDNGGDGGVGGGMGDAGP